MRRETRLTTNLQELREHEETMQSLRDELERTKQESKEQGSVSLFRFLFFYQSANLAMVTTWYNPPRSGV